MGPERVRIADVDPHAQRRFEVGADGEDLERAGVGSQLDEEVEIAVGVLIAAGDRPEQRDRPTAVACHDCLDLVPVSFDQVPERPHGDVRHARSVRPRSPLLSRVGIRTSPVAHNVAAVLRIGDAQVTGGA